jgi:GT2 family glycosyltransferase
VKYFLEQCLCSVQKAMQGIAGEIIVIDNCSADGSVEYLRPAFPQVTFIANTENPGFSKANNQGWRMATGQYVLFLNPDTILPEDSLQWSLAAMEHEPALGALGIRMVDGSGQYLPESKRGIPGAKASFYKLSGLTRLFPTSPVFARYYLGHLSSTQSQEVEVLAGAYMLVRKTVLEATGGFDERFFMYGEDVDLSHRIRALGYKNWYLADSTIIHFKGESTRKDAKYVTLFYKAMALFVEKHYGKQAAWYTFLLQVAIRVRAGLSFAGKLLLPARQSTHRDLPLLIVGSPEAAGEARSILKKNNLPDVFTPSTHLEEPLLQLIETHDIGEIIYCAGTISYKDIIRQLQELPPHLLSRFHAAGSRSIVGSQTKHTGGEALG